MQKQLHSTRRGFLRTAGKTAIAAGMLGVAPSLQNQSSEAQAAPNGQGLGGHLKSGHVWSLENRP
jgi:hypothetical protein